MMFVLLYPAAPAVFVFFQCNIIFHGLSTPCFISSLLLMDTWVVSSLELGQRCSEYWDSCMGLLLSSVGYTMRGVLKYG